MSNEIDDEKEYWFTFRGVDSLSRALKMWRGANSDMPAEVSKERRIQSLLDKIAYHIEKATNGDK